MDRKCKNCGKIFWTSKKYKNSKYCHTCRKNHKNCEICGKEIFVQARTCSKECAYELRKKSWKKTCNADHNFSKNSLSRKKWEKRLWENEGIINVWQRKEVKDKCKQLHLKNLGVENPSSSILIKKKKRKIFENKGIWTPLELLSEYQIYCHNVWEITHEHIRKYGNEKIKTYKKDNKNKKCKDRKTIDHKYSISQGFKNTISPEIIGSIVNLQILSHSKNASKNYKCSISLQKLVNDYNNFIDENKVNKKNKN